MTQALVEDMGLAAYLPKGKRLIFSMPKRTVSMSKYEKKEKSIEIRHAITYEGWDKNGERVSLKESRTILTTQSISKFWNEVQTLTANEYSLEKHMNYNE